MQKHLQAGAKHVILSAPAKSEDVPAVVLGANELENFPELVCLTRRDTTAEEINDIFREEARSERYDGILGVSEDPIVSSGIIQGPRASIVDVNETKVTGGNLVKVMSWYDNEWGYSAQMVRYATAALRQSVGAK